MTLVAAIALLAGLPAGVALMATRNREARGWELEGRPMTTWMNKLGSGSVDERGLAAYALSLPDSLPGGACSRLAERLGDQENVRNQARLTLSHWAGKGRCIEEITRVLGDSNPSVARRAAADALKRAGPHAQRVLPALLPALKDPDPAMRVLAAAVIERAGDSATPIQDALVHAASDETPAVRVSAIHALAHLPASSEAIVGVVRRAAQDPNPEARAAAMAAIEMVSGHPESPALLLRALSDSDPEVRAAAAWSLGGTATNAVDVRAGLARASADPSAPVRHAAAEAMERLAAHGHR